MSDEGYHHCELEKRVVDVFTAVVEEVVLELFAFMDVVFEVFCVAVEILLPGFT